MRTTDDAARAIEKLNGLMLHGRAIRVDYSATKKPHQPTPGEYMGSKRPGCMQSLGIVLIGLMRKCLDEDRYEPRRDDRGRDDRGRERFDDRRSFDDRDRHRDKYGIE